MRSNNMREVDFFLRNTSWLRKLNFKIILFKTDYFKVGEIIQMGT